MPRLPGFPDAGGVIPPSLWTAASKPSEPLIEAGSSLATPLGAKGLIDPAARVESDHRELVVPRLTARMRPSGWSASDSTVPSGRRRGPLCRTRIEHAARQEAHEPQVSPSLPATRILPSSWMTMARASWGVPLVAIPSPSND